MNLLILGGTGLVGGNVLRLALDEPRIARIVAPTRRPLSLQNSRIENPIVNFDSVDPNAPWWRVDAAISSLGTTNAKSPSKEAYERIETGYSVTVAKLVKDRGATAFVYVSTLGASATSHLFYPRVKGQTELRLQELGFPSLTLVRPSGIVGRRETRRRFEELILGTYRLARPLLPARWRVVSGEQVAKACLNAVLTAQQGTHFLESEMLHDR